MNKTFMLLALCVSLNVSAQMSGWGPQSRVVTDSIKSETLATVRQYNVYLPKTFDTDLSRQYPVLYLLHGIMDTNRGWTMRGHIQDVMDCLVASGEVEEMIVVTPDAGGEINKDWNGYFNMPGWNYEDFFFNEFVPAIEKRYRVKSDKSHRAIAGLSMGGGGATSYAQTHPEMFAACYAMSALMDNPDFGQPMPSKDSTSKMDLLTLAVKGKSCIDKVRNSDEATKNQLRTVNWFVDCGDDDFLLSRNIEFVQAMKMAGIPVEFRVRDGGHTWEYWHSALYIALPFVSRNFSRQAL